MPLSREETNARQRVRARVYRKLNKEKAHACTIKWRKENPERHLLNNTRSRSKQRGIPFNLSLSDIVIPAICPALGTQLVYTAGAIGPNTPSLDKFTPDLGYVRGNVFVISQLANAIKNNATWQQVRAVADWMERISKEKESQQ